METQTSSNYEFIKHEISLPSEFVQKTLQLLPERTREVIIRRFNLNAEKRGTLEEIGEIFKITRERIRQIEKGAIQRIREANAKEVAEFNLIFKKILEENGGAAEYNFFVDKLTDFFDKRNPGKIKNRESEKQNLVLILRLGEEIKSRLENKKFTDLFYLNNEFLNSAEEAIRAAIKALEAGKSPTSEEELFAKASFAGIFKEKNISQSAFHSYLKLSQEIAENPFGQWGLKEWPLIFPRNIRDKSYLIAADKKEPLHFKNIARLIGETWSSKKRPILPETVHNELIKDKRFVLVGRGTYALADWGYERGTVNDIIRNIMRRFNRPMSREEIVKEVSLQRFVKPGTIILNLKDKESFEKTQEGLYKLKN